MNENIKFEVVCYLQGYGSWELEVTDGDWILTDRIYTISVKSGILESNPISGKIFRFPAESTIIEENR